MKRRGTVYFNKHVNESTTKEDIKKVINKWIELCDAQTPKIGKIITVNIIIIIITIIII
jgi:hypothetical protein